MSAPGRNEPCPCGSGRKLKRCCGVPVQARSGYTETEVLSALRKLEQFSRGEEFERSRALAEVLFWGGSGDEFTTERREELLSSPMVAINFHHFFALDLAVAGEQTLLDLFLARREHVLSPAERRALEDLGATHAGIYEVAAVRPGQALRLRNLWVENREFQVSARAASRELGRGDLLATRVLRLPSGERILAGDTYPFDGEFKERILEQLEEDRLQAEAQGLRLAPQAFLKRNGFRFNHLWLESLPPARPAGRPPGAQTVYPRLIADLRHYLDGQDLSERVPREVRQMGLYLGRIAAAASLGPREGEIPTGVDCRRRPASRPCGGRLLVRRGAGHERLDWLCPRCDDGGTLVGWRATPFDLASRAPIAEPSPDVHGTLETRSIEIAREDLRRLMRLGHLAGSALTLLVAAQEGKRKAVLEGRRDEFAALSSCVALEFVDGSPPRRAADRLARLHALLAWAARLEPDLSPAALGAESVLREQARSRRLKRLPTEGAPDGGHCLHVRLLDVEPPVWRRLELASRTTLADLHHVLVLALGWTDSHLHLFEHDGRQFAPPDSIEDLELVDSRAVLLGELLPHEGDSLVWEYDFGDFWRHELRVESIGSSRPPRPRLLDGGRACPPEDCGGPPGYERLLEALADPRDPEHGNLREWAGEAFDPEAFDPDRHDRWLERLAAAWGATASPVVQGT